MQVHSASWLQLQQRLMCSTHSLSVSSQYTSPRPLCLGRLKVAEGRAMQMSQRLFERTWAIEDFSLLYLNDCTSCRKPLTSEKLHLLTRVEVCIKIQTCNVVQTIKSLVFSKCVCHCTHHFLWYCLCRLDWCNLAASLVPYLTLRKAFKWIGKLHGKQFDMLSVKTESKVQIMVSKK